MTVLQYFNIAMVVLLVNFKVKIDALKDFPILNGKYEEFTVEWYQDVGATLCYTILMSTVTPHASKIALPTVTMIKRMWDRGWSNDVSNDKGEALTKMVLQSDWEALYTGPEIPTFFVYGQLFTSLWCVMTYSSGMPILYPILSFNYFVLYWVYKLLLLKHY
jgi:hypothetical protein